MESYLPRDVLKYDAMVPGVQYGRQAITIEPSSLAFYYYAPPIQL